MESHKKQLWINFIIISAEDWPLKVNNASFLDSSVTLHENSWRSFVFCWRKEVGNVTLLSHPDCDVFMCWAASSVSSIFWPSYSHVGVCRQSDVSTEQVKVTLSVSLCSVTVTGKERIRDVESSEPKVSNKFITVLSLQVRPEFFLLQTFPTL